MTRELPILATASVALALRTGRQTQDRRPVRRKRPPITSISRDPVIYPEGARPRWWAAPGRWETPPWQKGDQLYVREPTMVINARGAEEFRVKYDSTGEERWVPWPDRIKSPGAGRRLANGCYREAARTWLRVLDVRPEWLPNMTAEDALAEGVERQPHGFRWPGVDAVWKTPVGAFREGFWERVYGRWDVWVWATTVQLDRDRSGLTERAVAHG